MIVSKSFFSPSTTQYFQELICAPAHHVIVTSLIGMFLEEDEAKSLICTHYVISHLMSYHAILPLPLILEWWDQGLWI